MDWQENHFKKFHDSFQDMGGRFHILELRVPVEQQLEYFSYSYRLRRKSSKINEVEYSSCKEKLENVEYPMEEKKKILSKLASSSEIRAYRLLEHYVQHPDEELVNWASMALMESRLAIESELTGEKQIFISTGLGGKGEKLRFYMLVPSVQETPFEDYQRKIIEEEFGFVLSKNDCETERLTISDRYVELVFLVPVATDIRAILETMISECNVYGNFLSHMLTVTNMKELTQDEVNQVLEKYGNT